MNTNENIKDQIADTLSVIETINKVKVNSFFKDKTMNLLFEEKEMAQINWSWFTPRLQLATLICVLFVNAYVLFQLKASNYEEEVSKFAEVFQISSTNSDSIFY
mgnify:CR=1 FL=1